MMRILLVLSVCLVAVAVAKPASELAEVKALIQRLLSRTETESGDDCPANPIRTSLWAFLPDMADKCKPAMPDDNMIQAFTQKITSLEDGELKNADLGSNEKTMADMDDMLKKIEEEFLGEESSTATYDDALQTVMDVHDKFIKPVEGQVMHRMFAIGKAVYRAAISGVEIPGLEDRQNEPGCLDEADSGRQVACVMMKSMLVGDAMEMWGAKIREHLDARTKNGGSPYYYCKSLYELKHKPQEEKDFGAVKEAVHKTVQCIRGNFAAIKAFLGQEKDLGGAVLPRLLASLQQNSLLMHQVFNLKHAGGYLLGHAGEEEKKRSLDIFS